MNGLKTTLHNFDFFILTDALGNILFSQNTYRIPVTAIKSLTLLQQQVCHLKAHDVAISNEVNTVSCGLHQFILTTRLQGSENLFLHVPFEMPKVFPLNVKIELEYLRLPALPVIVNKTIQMELIENIAAHPLAPPLFKDVILLKLKALTHFNNTLERIGFRDDGVQNKTFMALAKKTLMHEFEQLELFETVSRIQLSTGETLEAIIKTSEEGLHIDFKGSSAAKTLFIPEHITQSACLQAFKDFYFPKLSIDQNWFEYLNIRLPDCFLNSRKLPTQSLCAYYGYDLVYAFVIQSFCKNPRRMRGVSAVLPSYLVLLEDKKCLEIPASLGAQGESKEESQANYSPFLSWSESQLDYFLQTSKSLRLEKFYPRANRHGKGQSDGSQGIHLEFSSATDVEVLFIAEPAIAQVKFNKQGPIDFCEILLNDEKKLPVTKTEIINLKTGDLLNVLSAGGGAIVS